MAAVATSTSITALWLRSPECGVGTLAIAIVLPSGDHASGDEGAPGGKLTGKLQLPDVRRRAAGAPIARHEPHVRRRRRGGDEEVVVAHLERIVESLRAGLLFR